MKPMPLLLLYGIDGQTLPVDAELTRHSIQRAEEALLSQGWVVAAREVTHDLEATLAPFAPGEWLVFNLCEGSPSQPFYYAHAARELERRGYSYTGSDSVALHQTHSSLRSNDCLKPKTCQRRVGPQSSELRTSRSIFSLPSSNPPVSTVLLASRGSRWCSRSMKREHTRPP